MTGITRRFCKILKCQSRATTTEWWVIFAIFSVKSVVSGPEFDLIRILKLVGGVRRWRCREKFAGSPVYQGDIPGKLHPDHRGHLQTGIVLRVEIAGSFFLRCTSSLSCCDAVWRKPVIRHCHGSVLREEEWVCDMSYKWFAMIAVHPTCVTHVPVQLVKSKPCRCECVCFWTSVMMILTVRWRWWMMMMMMTIEEENSRVTFQ